MHNPGLPLLNALVFLTHGVSDTSAILASGYSYIATGALVAALALRLSGSILTPLAVPASWLAGRRTMTYSALYPPRADEMWRQIEQRLRVDAIVYSSLVREPGDPLLPGFSLVVRKRIGGAAFRLYRRDAAGTASRAGARDSTG